MSKYPVAIVGAGPAGISTALSLKDRGVPALLVDRASEVASSWRSRYDRLKLNTGRQFSHLPGRPYPKGTPTWPTRDQMVEHLDTHLRRADIDVRLNTTVNRIDSRPDGWRLQTSSGDIDARDVIVAIGLMHTPRPPDWPGTFTGEVIHSSAYRNPVPFAGRRVLVVGSGSSGMEIAHDLATGGATKVWLAVRTPPNIMLRRGPGGLPGEVISLPLFHAPRRIADRIALAARPRLIGDLTEFGLPTPQEGPFARLARLGAVPSLVDIDVIDAIRDGSIEVVAAVQGFVDDGVCLVDGRRLEPDALVCATGYRNGLRPIVGHLGVLDERDKPRASGPRPAAAGLWFIGYTSRPAVIGFMAKQSRQIARKIAG